MGKENLNKSNSLIQYNITIIIFMNKENLQLKKGPSTISKKGWRSGYRNITDIKHRGSPSA